MALTNRNKDNIVSDDKILSQIDKEDPGTVNCSSDAKNCQFDEDISLDVVRKKRFRIDGDNNRILELNTADMTVITRLERLYPKLQQLTQDAAVKQLDESQDLETVSNALTHIDSKMRQIIDEIFDSNVSELCAPSGSMFDPFNGEFRFEHIIEIIGKLYTDNIAAETAKISKRMKAHTDKYTKGK